MAAEKNSKTEQPHCFSPKASGVGTASVIPAKRRSVKRMIFYDFVKFICSVCKTNQKPKPPNAKKKTVHHQQPHLPKPTIACNSYTCDMKSVIFCDSCMAFNTE